MNGALLINKTPGVSSFGVIENLQRQLMEKRGVRKRELPKLGHGGTLDPFATGLLIVCVGRGVKLARYFLGSKKTYEGVMRFGETTIPGDPTDPISETSEHLPGSIEELRSMAHKLTLQPYLQTPPMHSAKKKDGKPLYELARQGIEVEREAKLCHLYEFDVLDYSAPRARTRVVCSAGTYIRTLTQDYARMLGSVALLDSLHRTTSGKFDIARAMTVDEIGRASDEWDQLPCWVSFDRMLEGFPRASATEEERDCIFQGKQNVLFNILKRTEGPLVDGMDEKITIYCRDSLIAIACRDQSAWGLERVFTPETWVK